ncbi:hypothetical protein CROQUDRAFT_659532 [Cronartium quercuum f. sp. fusiforme G11]|uniref:Deacetylase sirtuin-type domain-containing protein n=1 Tax=Cronartium quercuum f. sp. fusiforme G11 TaxID=708437 RepID=A0A9P6NJT5_9BASI|nr:hypothetical protein CROQUDRAFT_659532 [Cronartium quercuum f. sp. fusiforme G11]
MKLDQLKPLLVTGKPLRCQAKLCQNDPRALIKPDIVFFGEGLPSRFFSHLSDLPAADLLIVLGTSLQVQPFASLVTNVSAGCVRLLINLERVGEEMFDFDRPGGRDVLFLGQSDEGVKTLCQHLGWMDELQKLCESRTEKKDVDLKSSELLTELKPDMMRSLKESRAELVKEAFGDDKLKVPSVVGDFESTEKGDVDSEAIGLNQTVVKSDLTVDSLGKSLEKMVIVKSTDGKDEGEVKVNIKL